MQMKWKALLSLAAVALVTAGCAGKDAGSTDDADSEDFPRKPISLIVPYGAGGSTDTIARLLAAHMEKTLKQPVTVENVPGGNGAVGLQKVFNAKPDGYTIAMASGSIQTVIPQTTKLGYNPLEMTFIGSTHESVAARFVSGSSNWKTIDELVSSGKQQELVDATSGGFGVNDLGTAALSKAVGGLKYRALATDGGAEAVLRILAGDAHMNQNSATATLQYIKSGQLRPLLIESPSWPELEKMGVPTAQSKYGYSISNPSSVLAPPKLPESIRKKLEDAIKAALVDKETADRMAGTNELVKFRTGDEASKYVRQAFDFYTPIIKDLGVGK